MLFSRYLSGDSDTDKGGSGYDVCDEHGHDLRDFEGEGLKSEFTKTPQEYPVIYGIDRTLIPGRLLGYNILKEDQRAPCRDCSYESIRCRTIKVWLVYKNSGKVDTMPKEEYKRREEQKEEN